MSYRKPGLTRLIRMLARGEVGRLVLVTKDRLLRFGPELLFQLCALFKVEVVILDEAPARAQPVPLLLRDRAYPANSMMSRFG